MSIQKSRVITLLIALIVGSMVTGTDSVLGQRLSTSARTANESEDASAGQRGTNGRRRVYVPRHEREAMLRDSSGVAAGAPRTSIRQVSYQETAEATPIMEGIEPSIMMDSAYNSTIGCESCGAEITCGVDWSGHCDSCGVNACGGCGSCQSCATGCLVPCPQISLRSMEYFAGVQGFKGSPNRGRDGSFGFNAGMNWGFDLPCVGTDFFSAQFGLRTVQSNFYESALTTEQRDQLFLTTGLFRRVDYGLQGGLVADVLLEQWYTNMTLAQLRGQVSWKYQGGNELGFLFTSSIQDDTQSIFLATNQPANNVENWQALNTYRAFYTHQLNRCLSDCASPGGSATVFVGGSANGDGLFGSDFWFPLSDCWSLNSGFMYMIPQDATNPNGNINEAWNIGINLTYYPMGLGRYSKRYNRPLFGVADNGQFLVDR